ncbi:MAG: type II toxin-antitoxin system VapC family toxin [Janthinobacterium lividum]
MSYLLDTHTLIWSILDRGKLSQQVIETLEDTENPIFVSAVSLWEISIKFSLGKLELSGVKPEELLDLIIKTGYELISISPHDCVTNYQLSSTFHKDPFDKILIWQAIKHNYILITKDDYIKQYKSAGLRTFW